MERNAASTPAETAVHPFDPAKLRLGDTLTTLELEESYGISRDHPDFWSKVLHAKTLIEDFWRQRFAMEVTVSTRSQSVHICTHEEALVELERSQRLALRKQHRNLKRLLHVDNSALSERKARHLERVTRATAAQVAFSRDRQPIPRLRAPK